MYFLLSTPVYARGFARVVCMETIEGYLYPMGAFME